jgi:Putative Flp pilus-assembly TadE/G-like
MLLTGSAAHWVRGDTGRGSRPGNRLGPVDVQVPSELSVCRSTQSSALTSAELAKTSALSRVSAGGSAGASAPVPTGTWSELAARWQAVRENDERGSIIPLILGFCLLALLFISGAVALSDVFTQQRSLQSVCDGAAVYAANKVDPGALHGTGASSNSLPLADASQQVAVYLRRDARRTRVEPVVQIAPDGVTVEVTCREHNDVAFGFVILHAHGVDQTARSSARTRVVG